MKVPRPILFATLSILWVFPSIGAICILASTKETPGVSIERIIAAVLLAFHALALFFAWRMKGFRALRG